MTETKKSHSADGSFLGFLFQIERVLYWLSIANSGGVVGVEVDDDIVVQLGKGVDIETIYEQAKNTQLKSKTPFSDKSEDLWKTLSIWIQLVTVGNVNPSKSFFSAISNKKIPNSRLLSQIAKASKDDLNELKQICKKLKEEASTLRKGLADYAKIITECDDSVLMDIIDRIQIMDSEYSHDLSYKKRLKENLKMSEDLPFDFIYNSLFGYVSDRLIDAWKKKEEAWISVESFLHIYTQLIADFKKKKFIEKATSLLPVSSDDILNNRNKTYVEQLKCIGCDEEEILESIEHFLRATSEKSRYAKEGDVTSEMFQLYYEDLLENWKSVARPRFKVCKSNPEQHESVGYNVFYETIRYRGKLNNQEPLQIYTHKGAYHFLANDIRLGWHPEWEKKFKKKK